MTAAEIYQLEPEYVSRDLTLISEHVWEANIYAISQIEPPEIQIKVVKEVWFDSRRNWLLASLWFEGKPVAVIQSAGRDGRDWTNRIVTDLGNFARMVGFLAALEVRASIIQMGESVSAQDDLPSLAEFYGANLETVEEKKNFCRKYLI